MNSAVRRAAVLITGWAFLVLGFIGLFLPLLQGILFLLMGLIILSTEYVWAHHLLVTLRRRFPKLGAAADHASAKANQLLQRLFRNHPDP